MFNLFPKKNKKTVDTSNVGITELVFRDAHQSLLATRLRIDDMLPIADALDDIGYWSIESWGGATFDSCIRYLGENPWDRIKEIKKVMPKTRQQMLLRGQNLLGYRHYSDDVVRKFIDKSVENGISVFRIFDAMNDINNLKTAINQTLKLKQHAQGTISYTLSPVHTLDLWLELAKKIEDMGANSLCIKDMAGLLQPYVAYELITKLKENISIPIHMHCHATTGLSSVTLIKAIEAGVNSVDTAIGSMSMTYGHSATNSIVSILEHGVRKTGLDLKKLAKIDNYFRPIRAKYAKFEGTLRGVDSRILLAQVPGGMLTNMENQLKEQNALDRMDEVLLEIPKVRKDLGYIPLVTPTSQIVGTQSVLNVLTAERYKTITKETIGVLKGEYGRVPAPVNKELQDRALNGGKLITCRPADLIEPELAILKKELAKIVKEKSIKLIGDYDENLLTYALFPKVALTFFINKNNPGFFEKPPQDIANNGQKDYSNKENSSYTVSFKGNSYSVLVSGGEITAMTPEGKIDGKKQQINDKVVTNDIADNIDKTDIDTISAPLAGNIIDVKVAKGQKIVKGDVLVVLEAMKMETEILATKSGTIVDIFVNNDKTVAVGDKLLTMIH